jgi:ankyrin repeat protein
MCWSCEEHSRINSEQRLYGLVAVNKFIQTLNDVRFDKHLAVLCVDFCGFSPGQHDSNTCIKHTYIPALSFWHRHVKSVALRRRILNCVFESEENITESLRYMRTNGADIIADNSYVLRRAAYKGDLESVSFLITECGADPRAENDDALRSAAEGGHLDIARLLVIEYGADIHANRECAVRNAAANGHLDIVQFLIEKGADPNIGILTENDQYEDNALQHAAQGGYEHVVKYLLDHDADPRHYDYRAVTVAAKNGYYAILKLLVTACVNAPQAIEMAFFGAGSCGHLDLLKQVIQWSDGDEIMGIGRTMHAAAHKGYLDIVQLILNQYDSILTPDHLNNMLFCAVDSNNFPLVKMLLDKGVNPCRSDGYPFIQAARSNAPEILQLLLEYICDQTNFDEAVGNALYEATLVGSLSTVKILRMYASPSAIRRATMSGSSVTADYLRLS